MSHDSITPDTLRLSLDSHEERLTRLEGFMADLLVAVSKPSTFEEVVASLHAAERLRTLKFIRTAIEHRKEAKS